MNLLRYRVLLASIVLWAAYATFALAPPEQRIPAIFVSATAFAAVLALVPGCAPIPRTPICPWNWALFVFFLQLVGLPCLVMISGASLGTLPNLPSPFALNAVLLINAIAFVAFCSSYSHFSAGSSHRIDRLTASIGRESFPADELPTLIGIIYVGLGITGVFLTFGSLAGLWEYWTSPASYHDAIADLSSSWQGFLGIVLTTFLGFSSVVLWCRLIRYRGRLLSILLRVPLTLLSLAIVVVSFGMFNHNRGAFAAPLVAIGAVSLAKLDKVSTRTLLVTGVVILSLMPAYALYRMAKFTAADLIADQGARESISRQIDLVHVAQLYGGAPQFLGFFLEATNWAQDLHFGEVTVSSVISPVPRLGKSFRAHSGTAIFNQAIYGTGGSQDQIVPFQGELFVDFHLLGVIAGYCLLGWIIARIQRKFEASRSLIDIYTSQYAAVWVCVAVFGSISIVSQTFVYFFWPVYVYLFLANLRPRRSLPTSRTYLAAVPAPRPT